MKVSAYLSINLSDILRIFDETVQINELIFNTLIFKENN